MRHFDEFDRLRACHYPPFGSRQADDMIRAIQADMITRLERSRKRAAKLSVRAGLGPWR